MTSSELKKHGAYKFEGFIDTQTVFSVNRELDQIFLKNNFGSIVIDHSLSRLIQPSRLVSINLLELALKVYHAIFDSDDQYLINGVSVNQELNNPEQLPWHTDSRRAEIKAQIYLTGGAENSGGFQYLNGSHMLELSGKHHIDSEFIHRNTDSILNLSGSPGDLIVFDAYGIHNKLKCLDVRRTIMFNFLPRSFVNETSVDLNSCCLTKKVIDNLNLFIPNTFDPTASDRRFPENFKNLQVGPKNSLIFGLKQLLWNLKVRFQR